jgi:hypothetical protein
MDLNSYQQIRRHPPLIMDILRLFLFLLSFVVAGGFLLILLPQPIVDRIAQSFQSRSVAGPQQEKVAFLYLGDEVKDGAFHIRGVVRNIATQPLEQVDVTIRLYSHDGSLRETAILRLDRESIAPDSTAEFHLTYPNYNSQFSSYSVEFKLRSGEVLPYKDLRGVARISG